MWFVRQPQVEPTRSSRPIGTCIVNFSLTADSFCPSGLVIMEGLELDTDSGSSGLGKGTIA